MSKNKPNLEIFKPEDFSGTTSCQDSCSEIANEKLQSWLEQNGMRVYGIISLTENKCYGFGKNQDEYDTHTALLINIEKLKPKCEKHEPCVVWEQNSTFGFLIKCKTCGINLKIHTWTED